MGMLAERLIRLAAGALEDISHTRWSENDLIDYLNAAQYALVAVRPDAKQTSGAVKLAAGVKQSLPDDGIRLLELVRNMGADGSTPGRVITYMERQVLDRSRPDWPNDTAAATVKHYMYDPQQPRVFWVYPAVTSDQDVYVEEVYSTLPTYVPRSDEAPAYDANTDEIDVPGIFEGPLLDYMLFRAYMKDGETANAELANQHFKLFHAALEVKGKKDILHAPAVREDPYGDQAPKDTSQAV